MSAPVFTARTAPTFDALTRIHCLGCGALVVASMLDPQPLCLACSGRRGFTSSPGTLTANGARQTNVVTFRPESFRPR